MTAMQRVPYVHRAAHAPRPNPRGQRCTRSCRGVCTSANHELQPEGLPAGLQAPRAQPGGGAYASDARSHCVACRGQQQRTGRDLVGVELVQPPQQRQDLHCGQRGQQCAVVVRVWRERALVRLVARVHPRHERVLVTEGRHGGVQEGEGGEGPVDTAHAERVRRDDLPVGVWLLQRGTGRMNLVACLTHAWAGRSELCGWCGAATTWHVSALAAVHFHGDGASPAMPLCSTACARASSSGV
jgi:hypothetical protein